MTTLNHPDAIAYEILEDLSDVLDADTEDRLMLAISAAIKADRAQSENAGAERLQDWARTVAGFLCEDKGNDWQEELVDLEDILGEPKGYFWDEELAQ